MSGSAAPCFVATDRPFTQVVSDGPNTLSAWQPDDDVFALCADGTVANVFQDCTASVESEPFASANGSIFAETMILTAVNTTAIPRSLEHGLVASFESRPDPTIRMPAAIWILVAAIAGFAASVLGTTLARYAASALGTVRRIAGMAQTERRPPASG